MLHVTEEVYRSYKNIGDGNVINDVKSGPFWVCDLFDNEDDRLLNFIISFSSVIDSNAPIKKKILKKLSIPYVNSPLRQAIHEKKPNILRNAYKKEKSSGVITGSWEV